MNLKRGKLTKLDNAAVRAAYPFECEEAKALRRVMREQNAIEAARAAKQKPKKEKKDDATAATE